MIINIYPRTLKVQGNPKVPGNAHTILFDEFKHLYVIWLCSQVILQEEGRKDELPITTHDNFRNKVRRNKKSHRDHYLDKAVREPPSAHIADYPEKLHPNNNTHPGRFGDCSASHAHQMVLNL
jgi:hypothetical protein